MLEQRGEHGDAERPADLPRGLVEADRGGEALRRDRERGGGRDAGRDRAHADADQHADRQPEAEEARLLAEARSAHSAPAVAERRARRRSPTAPWRVRRRDASTATAAATIAPGVIASPASSGE